jgi:Flp pilus assembly pilin Flp
MFRLRLIKSERGATAIEYAMLAAILALGLIVAITQFGAAAQGLYTYVNTNFGNAVK